MKTWQIKNKINQANELGANISETDVLIYGIIGIGDNALGNDPKDFAQAIANLDTEVLNIRINSCGGDLFAGHAIYNIIKNFAGKKKVYIDGLAASAASLIAMAGDEIIMPANTMLMIHNAQSIAYGDSKDFKKIADDLDKMNETLIAVYQEKTGLDAKKLQKMLDNETWLTSNEALSLGFATSITDEITIDSNLLLSQQLNNFPLNQRYVASIKQFFQKDINANYINCHPNLNTNYKELTMSNVAPNNYPNLNTNINTNPNSNANIQNNTNITLESIKNNYSDIYNSIFNLGIVDGINQERNRIKSIDALPIVGHSELVYNAKYTNSMTPETLALHVIKAEKDSKNNYLANAHSDAQHLNNVSNELPTVSTKSDLSPEFREAFKNAVNKVNKEQR